MKPIQEGYVLYCLNYDSYLGLNDLWVRYIQDAICFTDITKAREYKNRWLKDNKNVIIQELKITYETNNVE